MARSMTDLINSPVTLLGWGSAMLISLWFVLKGIEPGIFYAILGLFGATGLFMFVFTMKESDIVSKTGFFFRGNLYASAALFCIGFLPFFIIAVLYSGLFAPETTLLGGAALTASIGAPLSQITTIGWLAPHLEEMWRLVAALLGIGFVYAAGVRNKYAYLLVGSVAGSLIFAGFHPIQTQMPAFIFGFIVTFLVIWGRAYELGVGMHMGNNLAYLGLGTIGNAWFSSAWGFAFFVFIFAMFAITVHGFAKGKVTVNEILRGGL